MSAARGFVQAPGPDTLKRLTQSVEPPRLEYLRRLNLAPGATADIVAMRKDLLRFLKSDEALAAVDRDFVNQLVSWFNRGFLVLQRIDWSTPANILEKIIRYEAVHEIQGWDDLRRRLDPADRRCFAFFHPSLVDEPLIFVQVALTREVPGSIRQVLEEKRRERAGDPRADDGGVLLDLELPGRPARHFLRQFPDQAGGRGPGPRHSQPEDFRDPVARARLQRLAGARQGQPDPAPISTPPKSPFSTISPMRDGPRTKSWPRPCIRC